MKKYDYTSDDKQNLDFNQIHNIDLGKCFGNCQKGFKH